MRLHHNREDLSRFLVHLTRDDGDKRAKANLISILSDRTIFACNAHCLVSAKLTNMSFFRNLRASFNTVCFTETPLTQIKQIARRIRGRKTQLKPYGLVFSKDKLFDEGASPAIYINAKGTPISDFLLDEFHRIFTDIRTLNDLKEAEAENHKNIVHYFSLINVVKEEHDFMWEREWRHHGDFTFEYVDVIAIIARNPEDFEKACEESLEHDQLEDVFKIPIIDPNWTYEELVEQLAISTWNKLEQ